MNIKSKQPTMAGEFDPIATTTTTTTATTASTATPTPTPTTMAATTMPQIQSQPHLPLQSTTSVTSQIQPPTQQLQQPQQQQQLQDVKPTILPQLQSTEGITAQMQPPPPSVSTTLTTNTPMPPATPIVAQQPQPHLQQPLQQEQDQNQNPTPQLPPTQAQPQPEAVNAQMPPPPPVSSTPTAAPVPSSTPPMKQRLQDLVNEVDPDEQLDEDVEQVLLDIADEFIENVVSSSCAIAKHRNSSSLEVEDVKLYLERKYKIWIPGFGESKPLPKRFSSEAHRQRMALINKQDNRLGDEVSKSQKSK